MERLLARGYYASRFGTLWLTSTYILLSAMYLYRY